MKLKYISWIPAVVIMCLIFYFSSKPDTESNESSLVITKTLLNTYENVIGSPIPVQERNHKEEFINHIIRKTAHFSEYAALALAIAFHLCVLGFKKRSMMILPILTAALYAAADEFHQTFVPGRSGQISDVLLDTFGACVGSMVFSAFLLLFYRRLRKPV